MKETYVKGNGRIAVTGYKHKIVISKSYDNGKSWHDVSTVKCYGSVEKVRKLFELNKVRNWESRKQFEEFEPVTE